MMLDIYRREKMIYSVCQGAGPKWGDGVLNKQQVQF